MRAFPSEWSYVASLICIWEKCAKRSESPMSWLPVKSDELCPADCEVELELAPPPYDIDGAR